MIRERYGNSVRIASVVMAVLVVAMPGCENLFGLDGLVAGCVEGEKECNGNTLRVCNGSGSLDDVPCEGTTCDPVALACVGECAPGKRCLGDVPQACDAQGQWVDEAACVQPEYCQGGQCIIECATGDLRCLGNTPQTCDDSGEWVGDVACSGQTCLNGLCVGECSPTDRACNGTMTQHCNTKGELEDESACVFKCENGACFAPSCEGSEPNCGVENDENCCASPLVTGGTYYRSNDSSAPATVSPFRLDRFEVTVARFRKFLAAYPESRPGSGAGEHPLIDDSGWDTTWGGFLPDDVASFGGALLQCKPGSIWTETPSAWENKPINCVSWYEAFAFCAWDFGRLPTEAEWNYAAAGGVEQRVYPWSNPPSSQVIDGSYAAYDCAGDGNASTCDVNDILTVGSRSPRGDGRWLHADLAGNVREWALDGYDEYVTPCNDCANLSNTYRVARGGGFNDAATFVTSSDRGYTIPDSRSTIGGFRCARAIEGMTPSPMLTTDRDELERQK